jgi:ABC-2 type transport system ATP-binding protein
MLLTTHYMEEADKLCDRIAIVDHGKLVALGTPVELKNSVAGANVVEVHFDREDEEWKARLEKLEGVTSVQPEGSGFLSRASPSRDRRPPCRLWSWPRAWARR